MVLRKGKAIWEGNLKEGKGTMELESGAYKGAYSFKSRFKNGSGTNPEELIGAAHAGCFSMALANILAEAGHPPQKVSTSADVKLDEVEGEPTITKITLNTEATVPGIDAGEFNKYAENAKDGCPVSKALQGVDIALKAKLVN